MSDPISVIKSDLYHTVKFYIDPKNPNVVTLEAVSSNEKECYTATSPFSLNEMVESYKDDVEIDPEDKEAQFMYESLKELKEKIESERH